MNTQRSLFDLMEAMATSKPAMAAGSAEDAATKPRSLRPMFDRGLITEPADKAKKVELLRGL